MIMPLQLLLRDVRLLDRTGRFDIGISDGRIVDIASSISGDHHHLDLGGALIVPGLVDSHVHLDKACLLDRCDPALGDLSAAIAAVSRMKAEFTEEDVYERGARVLESAIAHGTTHMRTHLEIDPAIGLRSFAAVRRLKRDYAWAIDLDICVFPQEGMTNYPGTEELLIEAIERGADLLGGCPYTDSDPAQQIEILFTLARRYDLDLDFHLDFDLDPSWMHLDLICLATERSGWGGRVAIGHVTKLSAVPPETLETIAQRLAQCGVAVTVLPATDLYLMGRGCSHHVPRGLAPAHRLMAKGVNCSIATNNVLNPFTPFGDASLIRMANFYANVAQVDPAGFRTCLDLVTTAPARLMNLKDYGVHVGATADMIALRSQDATNAVAQGLAPIAGFKAGRQTFERPAPRLLKPSMSGGPSDKA
ncbi:amidohydrolase family protein [Terrihabitans sp. B22-R8]|uniref:amidohydrolase family protein n=1 Tax=Terrihabitans sp. B22-R8 TaxID=3425128 RepID=UPI00403D21DF